MTRGSDVIGIGENDPNTFVKMTSQVDNQNLRNMLKKEGSSFEISPYHEKDGGNGSKGKGKSSGELNTSSDFMRGRSKRGLSVNSGYTGGNHSHKNDVSRSN